MVGCSGQHQIADVPKHLTAFKRTFNLVPTPFMSASHSEEDRFSVKTHM